MTDTGNYTYRAIFDDRQQPALCREPASAFVADRAPTSTYVFDDDIRLAVNLALATTRPLLVGGPSGAGKSSLAQAIADLADWSYVERTITSRLQARDLLYEIDYLKRLQDAERGQLSGNERPYLVPGPLFWAFEAEAGRELLRETGRENLVPSGIKFNSKRCVVLLDEIDKADPDVPNDLLIPFGRLAFEITELGKTIYCSSDKVPLLILTTNGERDLPLAFLRRCVGLQVKGAEDTPAGRDRLHNIARKHQIDPGADHFSRLADAFFAAPRPEGHLPNTAEFLDLLRAWRELAISGQLEDGTMDAVLAAITLGLHTGRP
jgi:MoxR-like ATPase